MTGQVAAVFAGGALTWGDPQTRPARKALLNIGGRPMVHWVLEALVDSGVIDSLFVVGLDPENLPDWAGRAKFVPDAGGLVANILAARPYVLKRHPDCGHVLLCSCDIPLISGAMVRRFLEQCGDRVEQSYYPVVTQKTMEARFPGSGRTFVRMRGGRITLGNMALMHPSMEVDPDFAKALVGRRKQVFSLALTLGWGFLLRFALGRLTTQDAAARLGELAGTGVVMVNNPDAEVAMDVDKPEHYERIKREFEKAG